MVSALNWRSTSTFAGALYMTLAACLLFAPGVIYWVFHLSPNAASDVFAARAGCLFLGLGSLMALTRSHPSSATRTAIADAMAVMLLGIAILGLLHWITGAVGAGIFLAIIAEVLLAAAFVYCR